MPWVYASGGFAPGAISGLDRTYRRRFGNRDSYAKWSRLALAQPKPRSAAGGWLFAGSANASCARVGLANDAARITAWRGGTVHMELLRFTHPALGGCETQTSPKTPRARPWIHPNCRLPTACGKT